MGKPHVPAKSGGKAGTASSRRGRPLAAPSRAVGTRTRLLQALDLFTAPQDAAGHLAAHDLAELKAMMPPA